MHVWAAALDVAAKMYSLNKINRTVTEFRLGDVEQQMRILDNNQARHSRGLKIVLAEDLSLV